MTIHQLKQLARWSALAMGLLGGCVSEQSALNPQGPQATVVANLAWLMFAIAAIVLTIVTLLLVGALFRGRQTSAAPILPRQERNANRLILIGGILVPAVTLVILMGISIVTEQTVTAAPVNGDLTIEVIGHQWWWEINYPGSNIQTANEIHIPVGTTVIWQNVGQYPRTVTFDPTKSRQLASTSVSIKTPAWDSGMLYPGQTWSYTFEQAGTYLYASQYPPGNHLTGLITVTDH